MILIHASCKCELMPFSHSDYRKSHCYAIKSDETVVGYLSYDRTTSDWALSMNHDMEITLGFNNKIWALLNEKSFFVHSV